MASQSLLADGDLDLRNNYQNDDGSRFGAGGLEVGQHALESRSGTLLPSHDIGVSLLLTPVYAVATVVSRMPSESLLAKFRMTRGLFAYSLISLCIIGLVTAAGVITRDALVAQGSTPALASIVVVAAWLSPPVLTNSFLVYPEPFALLATAFALHVASSDVDGPLRTRVMALAAVLGLLPWFHRKYAVYGALLLFAVVWPQRTRVSVLSRRDRMFAISAYVVPQVGLGIWTWYHWANLGGPLTMMELPPFSWTAFQKGSSGILVDRENGLLVWAPVYALIPAAWALAGRRYALWLLPTASLLLMSAAHEHWWGGFSPAARFLVPAIPLFACVAAVAARQLWFRYLSLVLLIPQAFIAADVWQHTRSLWPQGDGHNRILADLLGVVGASERLLPSLRTSPGAAARAALTIAALVIVNVVAWASARKGNEARPGG